jgi:hypothetical protein
MKNVLFYIALLSGFCGLLEAADQQYPFDDTDKALFRVGDSGNDSDHDERVGALYSTALINSVADSIQSTIDRNSLFDICESAIAQTVHLKEKGVSIPVRPPKGQPNTPFSISLQPLKIGPERIHDANTRAYAVHQSFSTVNYTVTINDKNFLLLLQFAIQKFKRNGTGLWITLHPNFRSTQNQLCATPLLEKFMEKYRAYENKDVYDA